VSETAAPTRQRTAPARATRSTSAWLPWSLAGVAAVLAASGLVLSISNDPHGASKFAIVGAVLGVSFPLVGAVIAARQPHNPIGWIFCAIGLSQGLDTFDTAYSTYVFVAKAGPLPGADVMAWLSTWTYAPGFALLMTFSLLLFPDGHLPSARWRPVAWLSVVALVLDTVPVAVVGWHLRGPRLLPGPTAPRDPALALALGIQMFGVIFTLTLGLAAALSVFLRFRRARGVQRQQLKWFAYAAVVGVVLFAASLPLPPYSLAGVLLGIVVSPIVPLAAGIAILRYRLYDIDHIINRTLVYGAVTAALAITYIAGVVAFGSVVRQLGGQESSSLAVAASTLMVAALFEPLRKRVQFVIDRHFYRRRYDAVRTIESFSARLRDEVDLQTLSAQLVAVVGEVMQPTGVSLWLRETGRPVG
jgi:hypothetical protein